ncbi:MAG: beta-lactamase family protein, partial [Flavobacteriaceae bacterium]|nr:beta-lactamase family protein [Flavobacteriaceae bacterium]
MTRNFSIAFLCTIISFSLTNCKKQTNNIENAVFEKTDAYVERMIDSSGIIGLNYAVLIDGKLAHKKAFGLANLDHKIPMTLEKLFSVASISKLFSSTALHHLLDKNKRNVDETVGDFLSERNDLPDSWKQLTLKQLLSHTSGIPDQIDYQIYLAPESEAFVIASMKDKPFSSKPGTESKYNATGFLIIRMLIEKLANQDFESYM